MKIHFATSNPGKFKEAQELLKKYGIEVEQYNIDLIEIQSDSTEEIALTSVRTLFKEFQKPVFVEDAGLFVKALNGFPGAYSKHAFLTVGLDGILKLLKDEKDRTAEFQAVIAYKDNE